MYPLIVASRTDACASRSRSILILALAGILATYLVTAAGVAGASGNHMVLETSGDVWVEGVKANPNAVYTSSVSVSSPVSVPVCTPCTTTPTSVNIGYIPAGREIVVRLYIQDTNTTIYSTNTSAASVTQLSDSAWVVSFEDGGGPPVDVTVSVDVDATAQPRQSTSEQGGAPSPRGSKTTCNTDRPVNCATGTFWHTFRDFAVPGRGLPLALDRTYDSSRAAVDTPFGHASAERSPTRSGSWTPGNSADATPAGESSTTTHAFGSTSRRAIAVKYGSESGFPVTTSSAVTKTSNPSVEPICAEDDIGRPRRRR
jgi:hypothetical protein